MQMLAIQSNGVNWVHQDPITKSQKITNSSGAVTSTIDLDPWGGETSRSSNQAFQPQRYTTYTRDNDGGDDAMHRRYGAYWTRFSQPDPYDGSYSLGEPQSFNRYSYVQNDPVNFMDPSGLDTNITLIPMSAGEICRVFGVGCPSEGGVGDWGGFLTLAVIDGSVTRTNGTQNPAQTPTPQNDCLRFADLVQGIADRSNSDREFLDELARTFTSANHSGTREMRDNSGGPVNPPRPSFLDSGFKTKFQDGSNQVRHFVAGFIAGANLGIPGLLFMNSREDDSSKPQDQKDIDIRLNGVSTNLGSWFTGQPSSLEFRRARLAAEIREELCQ